jgi:glycosyltransferase involved in cell wall biosynthesis
MLLKSNALIENPVCSVIIITYNQETTITQTIESILAQKCNYSFEIIIGEDCSNDTTRAICINYQKRYPEKILLLLQENNKGVVPNYFETLSEAKGTYIAQCAGDDYWHNPNKLQMQIEFLEDKPDYGFVHTDVDVLDCKSGKISKNNNFTSNTKIIEGYAMKEIWDINRISAPTVCFRMDAFKKYIRSSDFIRLQFPMEDWPMWIILSKYYKVGYIPISTATYRTGQNSIINESDYSKKEKYLDGCDRVCRYLANLFPEELDYSEKDLREFKYTALLDLAFLKKDFSSARKYASKLIKDNHSAKKVLICKNRLFFYLFIFYQQIYRLFN